MSAMPYFKSIAVLFPRLLFALGWYKFLERVSGGSLDVVSHSTVAPRLPDVRIGCREKRQHV